MVQCVMEATGANACIRQALDVVCNAGRVVYTGWPKKTTELPTDVFTKKELDIRDSQCATWRDVVYGVLRKLGKQTRLSDIYAEIEGHQKTKTNPHWKEKVRQTLQVLKRSGKAEMVTTGVWQLAAA